jgi:hypothetical protein
MGFTNGAQNVRALLATAGNVHAAIEYILGGGGVWGGDMGVCGGEEGEAGVGRGRTKNSEEDVDTVFLFARAIFLIFLSPLPLIRSVILLGFLSVHDVGGYLVCVPGRSSFWWRFAISLLSGVG